MYASLSTARQADLSVGEGRIETDQVKAEQERASEQEALKKAAANQANSGGGFFSSIGHLFEDVGKDLISGDLGDVIHDAGRDLEDAWNSPAFWHDLETGLEGLAIVAGAVFTAGIGGAVVLGTAAAVAGAAGVGAGLSAARNEHFAAASVDANADATEAQNQIDKMQDLTSDVLTDLKEDDQSHQRALQSVSEAIQTHDQATVTAASMSVKG